MTIKGISPVAPKKEAANVEAVKEKIMDGYKRGICNSYGQSESYIDPATGKKCYRPKIANLKGHAGVSTYKMINGKFTRIA